MFAPKPAPKDAHAAYPIRVIRSKKRKRTVSAQLVDGVLELHVPHWISAEEEREFVDRMQRRFARKKAHSSIDLEARCAVLAERYQLPRPASVRWVTNQSTRWGSCTPSDASIRLSTRMQAMPAWVVDAVLVHELAHLVVPDHGPAFKALEARFERQVEASAFLDGVMWARSHPPDFGSLPPPLRSENSEIPAPVLAAAAPEKLPRNNPVELEGLNGRLDLGQLRFDLS